ncbi:MAG: cupin domain-containing protein [Solirubrobacteraceae bacterium]
MPEDVTNAGLDPAPAERFVRLRAQLGVSSFGLNQIALAPGQRSRIHRHIHQEEVYLVLDGTLTLEFEDGPREYTHGELVRVAPHVRRRLVNRHRTPLSLLALGGSLEHEHQGRDAEAFADWADSDPHAPQDMPLPEDLPASDLT